MNHKQIFGNITLSKYPVILLEKYPLRWQKVRRILEEQKLDMIYASLRQDGDCEIRLADAPVRVFACPCVQLPKSRFHIAAEGCFFCAI